MTAETVGRNIISYFETKVFDFIRLIFAFLRQPFLKNQLKQAVIMDQHIPCLPKGTIQNAKPFFGGHNNSEQTTRTDDAYKPKYNLSAGIDLGTKHCCVAVSIKQQIKVIPNTIGKNTTPSYVSFEENGSITIGENAKSCAFQNPKYTIFDSKRMIGRNMNDKHLQTALKGWQFDVEACKNGLPKIRVRNGLLAPEEVSAKLVKFCMTLVEKALNAHVTTAVIAIPAYFNDNQKRATVEAGKLAGLKTIHLLPEPTAAAIAYQHTRFNDQPKRVLIFDLGAGTFDIAVVDIIGGNINIIGDGGDAFLGGDDFDTLLIDYSIDVCNKANKIDIRDSNANSLRPRALSLIREECEKKKIQLSTTDHVKIVVPCVFQNKDKQSDKPIDMTVDISKKKYEELIQPLVDKLIQIVSKTLQETNISKDEIEDIVLVGASTRTPKIQAALQKFFNGKPLNTSVNPDDAVAYGAAINAACLHNTEAKRTYGIELVQAVSISIGVQSITQDSRDHFARILPKGTAFLKKKTVMFRTNEDYQETATIYVYQGEDPLASRNVLIGTFELLGIPRNKAGEELITVSMQLDENGLLHVTAASINGSSSNHIDIQVRRI